MNKYIKDGKVAVLVSPGLGAGWSTWAHTEGSAEYFSMDKQLVELRLNNVKADEVEDYLNKTIEEAPYMGGWKDVVIEWLDKGTVFTIDEYDGSECIRLIEDLSMTA